MKLSIKQKILIFISSIFTFIIFINYFYDKYTLNLFKKSEIEKVEIVLDMLTPSISTHMEFNMVDNLNDLIESIFNTNGSIIDIEILNIDSKRIFYKKSIRVNSEEVLINLSRDILDISGVKVGEVKIKYSRFDYNKIYQSHIRVRIFILIMTFLSISIMLYWIDRAFFSPFNQLVSRIKSFKPDREIQIFKSSIRDDEIGLIESAMHKITNRVISYTREIKELNSNLESKINERTKELKHSHSLIRATLESTANGILVVSKDREISIFNKKFQDIWKIPDNYLNDRDDIYLTEYIASKVLNRDLFLKDIESIYLNQEGDSFNTIYLKSGKIIERYSRAQILNQEIVGRVWSFRDVTKSKKVEEDLKLKTQELKRLNQDLERKIEREIESRREKESLLLQQSRLAGMGEMIGNIAHQWRQPLNELSLIIQSLSIAKFKGSLSDDFIDNRVEKAEGVIERMSTTIDDFRSFFKEDKTRDRFNLSEAFTQAKSIIEMSLEHNYIELIENIDKSIYLYGFSGEYSQVILNILSNSKDILLERGVENPKILVYTEIESENRISLNIEDNAGGIKIKPISKIFEPYFSTKHSSEGTGIGLYMSKIIIEKNMKGYLEVENSKDGAKFKIII